MASGKVHPFSQSELDLSESQDRDRAKSRIGGGRPTYDSPDQSDDSITETVYTSDTSEDPESPRVVHSRSEYNEYDLDGHRIPTPEREARAAAAKEAGEGDEAEEGDEKKKKCCGPGTGKRVRTKFRRGWRRVRHAVKRSWPVRTVRRAWKKFRYDEPFLGLYGVNRLR